MGDTHVAPERLRRPPAAAAAGRRGRIDPRLVCLARPESAMAERYNRLRHTLERMSRPGRALVVGVTSPGEADGKTLTAINLAAALARDERSRVLLLDLDLRRSGRSIGEYLSLDVSKRPGVADWIQHGELQEPTAGPASGPSAGPNSGTAPGMRVDGFNVDYLHAGKRSNSVYELLRSPGLDELLDLVRRSYRFIVLDTPHALLMSDIELIARLVDGFLVVVKADHTTRQSLENTLNLLDQDRVLGLVFNGNSAPD
jgi:receptor protein-tyrosine kinase/non-specific protein-tyrosine kinase